MSQIGLIELSSTDLSVITLCSAFFPPCLNLLLKQSSDMSTMATETGRPTITAVPIVPLTTTFTPQPECFTAISWNTPYGFPGNYYGISLGSTSECTSCWFGLPSSAKCFPTGWDTLAVYSPGLCPSGYTVACSSEDKVTGTDTEMVGTCCPR